MDKKSGERAKYRVIDHEADVGLALSAPDYETLFHAGALGLFSLLADLGKVGKGEARLLSVPHCDDSLIIFLNDLLYLWDVERFIPKAVETERVGDTLHMTVRGETFDERKHEVRKEVKAVTYHGFDLRETGGGFEARLILDI